VRQKQLGSRQKVKYLNILLLKIKSNSPRSEYIQTKHMLSSLKHQHDCKLFLISEYFEGMFITKPSWVKRSLSSEQFCSRDPVRELWLIEQRKKKILPSAADSEEFSDPLSQLLWCLKEFPDGWVVLSFHSQSWISSRWEHEMQLHTMLACERNWENFTLNFATCCHVCDMQ